MADLRWGSGTHPGLVRPENEDSLYAGDGVFVVADGMGGHEAGEVASHIAVERIRATLEDEAPLTAERVVDAISSANGDIFRASIANPGQAGMGTTVTAIAVIADPMAGRGEPNIDENDPIETAPDGSARITPVVPREQPEALVLANVGDSRTYLFRHERLRRVTIDHSYVQELVATGHITDDEARLHPRRNIVTRALGIEPDVKVDWWTLPLVKGDRFVLCSDGLSDYVTDAEITQTLLAKTDPQEAADQLITQANEAGGGDNVTAVVVDVLDGDDPPDPTQEIDLIPTWADEPIPTLPPREEPTGAGATDDDASATDGPKRKRSGLRRAIGWFLVIAIVLAGLIAVSAWARRGYFVDFDDDGDVIVYQGRPGGFLWIEPTAETTGGITRDELESDQIEEIEDQPTFSSIDDAIDYVRDLGGETSDPQASSDTSDTSDSSDTPDTSPPDTEP